MARRHVPKILVIKLSALGDFVLALAAMKKIRQAHPKAHISLLTTPPFEALAKASPYFNAVDTDGRPESFGRAAVEPQAMGRPVIASNHGGTVETVSDGTSGWLVAPGDAPAWASAMTRAIDLGPGRRLEMGQIGMNRTRQLYRVDAMCAATLAAYEQVLQARLSHEAA